MKTDWTASLQPNRTTGDAPTGGVAADMNLVRAALTEIRSNVPNAASDIGAATSGHTHSSGLTGYFDVTSYGATGNGSTDDTAAFQSAINAALVKPGSTLYIPPPPSGGTYKITDTLKLYDVTSSANQYYLNVEARLPWNGITWMGAGNKAVFQSRGLKYSTINGLNVTVQVTASNVVIWDLDVGVFGSVNYTSSGENDFNNCYFSVNATASIIGWRLSYSSNSADISQVTWRNCNVFGNQGTSAGSRTSIGWQSNGSNTLNLTFYSCSMAFCSVGWTTIPGSGSAGTNGGDSMYFFGCGGSYNDIDFQLKTTGNFVISGGRWEEGRQLLSMPNGGAYAGLGSITMTGVRIETYSPPSGRLIDIGNAVILNMTGCVLRLLSVAATAQLIYVSTGAGIPGAVNLQGCVMPVDAYAGSTSASPYTGGITTGTGTWNVHVRQSIRVDSGNLATTMIDY